jgi:hypothetical protein
MRKAEDFLPFIQCALDVFGSQTDEAEADLPPGVSKGVRFEYSAIVKFLGRDMVEDEYVVIGEILCESMDEKDECGVWRLAHLLQHLSEENSGPTH